MKAAVFNFTALSERSTLINPSIAWLLAETLKVPAFDNGQELLDYKPDVLFLVNGIVHFCKWIPQLAETMKQCKRVVWVTNDYNINPKPPARESSLASKAQSPFLSGIREAYRNGVEFDYWTTIKDQVSFSKLSAYVNWNRVAWNPMTDEELSPIWKKSTRDLFYYGAMRPGRLKVFDRFLTHAGEQSFDTVISTPVSMHQRWSDAYPKVKMSVAMKRESFLRELASHGLGLYLEDTKSSTHFHSPACRLYEMLGAGLPIVFQDDAVEMLALGGFDVSDYTISSLADVEKFMRKRNKIREEQRQLWGSIDHVALTKKEIRTAFKRMKEVVG